jgi:hypothetical protein
MQVPFRAVLDRLRSSDYLNHDGQLVLHDRIQELVVFAFEGERAITLVADDFQAPGVVAVIADQYGDHPRIRRRLALIFDDLVKVIAAPAEENDLGGL